MNDKTNEAVNKAVNKANLGPDQKRHNKRKKVSVPEISPEQKAALVAIREAAAAEAKAEAQRVELYGKSVEKMSHKQLRGELRRAVKREYAGRPPQPQPGLTIAFSTVLLTMLENTHTPENPFAKLSAYPR